MSTETVGYNSASLWVACYSIMPGGSVRTTLGTPVEEAPYATPIYLLPSGNTAQDYIVHIDGRDTWTGTGTYDGALITYGLFSDPGVSSVLVIFTIMEE